MQTLVNYLLSIWKPSVRNPRLLRFISVAGEGRNQSIKIRSTRSEHALTHAAFQRLLTRYFLRALARTCSSYDQNWYGDGRKGAGSVSQRLCLKMLTFVAALTPVCVDFFLPERMFYRFCPPGHSIAGCNFNHVYIFVADGRKKGAEFN